MGKLPLIVLSGILAMALTVAGKSYSIPQMTQDAIKKIIQENFEVDIYDKAGDTKLGIVSHMLRMYTHYTMEQLNFFVEDLMEIVKKDDEQNSFYRKYYSHKRNESQCILGLELGLIQSYKTTWHNNLHCIKQAQVAFEQSFQDLLKKVDLVLKLADEDSANFKIKLEEAETEQRRILLAGRVIIRFEELSEKLENIKAERNSISSRYLIKAIAEGCNTQASSQAKENSAIGGNMLNICVAPKDQPKTYTFKDTPMKKNETTNQIENSP